MKVRNLPTLATCSEIFGICNVLHIIYACMYMSGPSVLIDSTMAGNQRINFLYIVLL